MSIITLVRHDDRATVAVDTQTMFPDGRVCETSKALFVPHITTVIACRGTSDLARNASDLALFATSFDDAVTILRRELPGLLARLMELETDVPAEHSIDGPQELVLVGWSLLAKRMVGLQFWKRPGDTHFELTELGDFYAAPITESFRPDFATPGWLPETDDDLVRLARAQIACGRNASPVPAWGGRLLLTELDKTGARFRTLAYGL